MKDIEKEKILFDDYGNVAKLHDKTKLVILRKEYDRATGEENEKFKWATGKVKFKKNDVGDWEYEKKGSWEKIDPDIVTELNEWFLRDWFVEELDNEPFAKDEVEFVLKTRPNKIVIKMKDDKKEEEIGDMGKSGYVKWHERINTERKHGNHISFKSKDGKEMRRYFGPL